MSLPFRKLVLCGGAVIAGTAIASAAASLTPVGSEYPIVGSLPGEQINPAAAVTPTGGFVVWQDNSITPIGTRICAARIGAGFTVEGSSYPVSRTFKSKGTGNQEKPKIALLPGGSGAVVVWQQAGAGRRNSAQQVYARFLNSDGTPLKSDIRVGTHPKNTQSDPAVAVLSDGTVMVTWSSLEQDGNLDGVFAQLFSSTGGKIGKEFQVNQFTSYNQHQADVAGLVDGTFIVTWISEFESNPQGSIDVIARRFAADGTPVTGEMYISTVHSNACANPSVVAIPTGGYAIAWSQKADTLNFTPSIGASVTSQELTDNSWDVYGRFFDAAGTPVVEPVRLNETEYGDQYAPKLATCGQGCMAVWTSLGQDGSREGVYGRLLNNIGEYQGGEFRMNSTTVGPQFQPSVVSNGDSSYIGIWSSINGSGGYPVSVDFDIFAQVYLQSSGL